jgi:hypothetical protein
VEVQRCWGALQCEGTALEVDQQIHWGQRGYRRGQRGYRRGSEGTDDLESWVPQELTSRLFHFSSSVKRDLCSSTLVSSACVSCSQLCCV